MKRAPGRQLRSGPSLDQLQGSSPCLYHAVCMASAMLEPTRLAPLISLSYGRQGARRALKAPVNGAWQTGWILNVATHRTGNRGLSAPCTGRWPRESRGRSGLKCPLNSMRRPPHPKLYPAPGNGTPASAAAPDCARSAAAPAPPRVRRTPPPAVHPPVAGSLPGSGNTPATRRAPRRPRPPGTPAASVSGPPGSSPSGTAAAPYLPRPACDRPGSTPPAPALGTRP